MQQAFILGAGMGKRLRPLTTVLPKPLIPVYHRPMAAYAFDACAALGINRFAVNTHHLADAWRAFEPPAGTNVEFFHEPELLDTGGGLKNIEHWASGNPLLVHNGDIITNLPLEKLFFAHRASGMPVTLVARSNGPPAHLALDSCRRRVTDIRGMLENRAGTHGFAGIYCVNPEFFGHLPGGKVLSVIPTFLECIRRGELGVVVIDDGMWLDLGDRESYLRAHRELALAPAIHPEAVIDPSARVTDSVVGAGAVVGADAMVASSVVWPGAVVERAARIERCVVVGRATGGLHDVDVLG
jgi:NDP-sugar pyrophosphorylase family protein